MPCIYKHSNKLEGNFKTLTLEDKKSISVNTVYILADCGCFLRVKVNGKPKTWKKNPDRVQIPYKYGLYDYGYITEYTETRIPI